MSPVKVLGIFELSLALGVFVASGLLTVALGLGLARTMAWAATRMVLQLLLVGFLLTWLFRLDNPWAVGGVVLFMTANATQAAVARTKRTIPGLKSLTFLVLMASAVLVALLGGGGILGGSPWWHPKLFIPITGMILGNALTGIALVLDAALYGFREEQATVELRLSLGASPWEAARPVLQDAIRTGTTPIINSMAITGLVSLPGMMTGQILGGVSPLEAVRYQIVILCLIAAATILGGSLAAFGVVYRVFDSAGRLRSERILLR